MEIRIHGRGGQGGVTCAKLLAAVYAHLGKSVQAFGDYAGERSGAPVRAYVRVGDAPITNRNKVYRPDHLLVLDRTLLDAQALSGLAPGGLLLVNTAEPPAALADPLGAPVDPAGTFRRAAVDATAIARRHGIGSRSVVIVNTTIAGAFARALDLPWEALEEAYGELGLAGDLPAAREAWEGVRMAPAVAPGPVARPARPAPTERVAPDPERPPVLDLVDHRSGPAPALRTGSWRSQTPRYARHLSPCNAVCPAGNDVVGFVQALATDGEEAAAEVLARTTPLPGVCGRVCPAFCMAGCNRSSLDGAVHVRGLERWIADRVPVARRGGGEVAAPVRPLRVAVVGGGPAGLSAAYALVRHGHLAAVFEAAPELGGLLRYGIPPYRLPREVLAEEVRALLDLGVEARCDSRLGPEDLEALAGLYDGVILTTGQQRRRASGAPGADLPGVMQGLDFLARGEAIADGLPPVRHAVVLGGGNTAIDCARTALRCGAERVTLAYRRSRDEMPAIPEEVDEAVAEGVELLFLRAPVGFAGNGRLAAVELAEMRLGEPDASGRRRPVPLLDGPPGRVRLDCDLALLALGQSSDLGLLPDGWALEEGAVRADGRDLPVLAAGDLATGEGTVAHAIGAGRRAAQVLLEGLGEPVAPWRRPDPAAAVPLERIRLDRFPRVPPARPWHLPPAERRRSFGEGTLGLESAEEARRCFACGDCTGCDTCLVYCPEGAIVRGGEAYVIDYDVCKGCGICVAECPRDGMEMLDAWLPS